MNLRVLYWYQNNYDPWTIVCWGEEPTVLLSTFYFYVYFAGSEAFQGLELELLQEEIV